MLQEYYFVHDGSITFLERILQKKLNGLEYD